MDLRVTDRQGRKGMYVLYILGKREKYIYMTEMERQGIDIVCRNDESHSKITERLARGRDRHGNTERI